MNNQTAHPTAGFARKTPSVRLPRYVNLGLVGGGVLLLLVSYGLTLLTHVAGSNAPFLEDGGEIQVALNVWGTLHGTSYPLFTILGNLFVTAVRALGINAATAPSLYALAWGLVALGLFYALLRKLTGSALLAAVSTLLLALTRGVWAYNVLPKTYSMSLAFFVAILVVALWPSDRLSVRYRFWLLALIGGFGVSHHRLIAFAIPGVLIAVLPLLWRESSSRRRWRWLLVTLAAAIPLAMIGFLPYLYLPARALAHGVWIDGDPSTLPGFWREFTAQEFNYLFALPANWGALLADLSDTLQIFVEQLSPIGIIIVPALAGYAMVRRHEARIALVCALPVLAFVLVWHRAVVAQAVVMPMVMYLVFAAALGLADILARLKPPRRVRYYLGAAFITIAAALFMAYWSLDNLFAISDAREGDQEIALAQTVPRDNGSVFMLPWGLRYSAVAFSHYVTSENAHLNIADHNGNLGEILRNGQHVYTDKDTFYLFPLSWWQAQFGHLYLRTAAPDVVTISVNPLRNLINPDTTVAIVDGILRHKAALACTYIGRDSSILRLILSVSWGTSTVPNRDFSIFVHLVDASGKVLATADQSAPVYGLYPTSRWSAGEVVTDIYTFDAFNSDSTAVQFGLYEHPTAGQFVNYGTMTLPIPKTMTCAGS